MKNYHALAVCRFLFFCLMMQLATIQQAVALESLAEPISLSSLLPLLATVYRGAPKATLPLPDLDPPLISDVAPQYRQIKSQLTFQDSIGLKLDEEESLVLAPSEFPAVAKVSDMADENWPQLIAAESVDSDTGGIRSVFRWADQWRLNAFPDDPLLRFLAFIHGAAFCVQDNNGQLSYIILRNGKLLSVSRFAAYLQFSLYSQSFLESLYPEIFGPSLPAGGGWHEWNRFVRKQPFHPYERLEHNPDKHSGAQRPVNPEGVKNPQNKQSTRSETYATHHSEGNSEQARKPSTASTKGGGKQEHVNLQKVEGIYDYRTPENDYERPIPLYAIAFLNKDQQHLYCSVCEEFITGEAKACHSSPPHSVCIDCFNAMTKAGLRNIGKCVTCSLEMYGGSFNYEEAAAVIMFQCPLGCNHSCPLAMMKNHIKEHYSDSPLEDRSAPASLSEKEQAISRESVLFYGVPVMPEDKDKIEQFLLNCRQINDPEHLQLAEAFTRVFEAAQNRCQQLADGHSGQQSTGEASHIHHQSYAFFNSGGNTLDSAYLQCIRSTSRHSATCRFCNTRLSLKQDVVMGIREHLKNCWGIVPCPNAADGCTFEHQPAIVPMHLRKCRYNKVKCRICYQQVALSRMRVHREICLPSVRLNQDDALFYDRTEQSPVELYTGEGREGIIPVFKKSGEDTYYCRISKIFYESVTRIGYRRETHCVKFIGDDLYNSDGFSIEFNFDLGGSSFSFRILSKLEHRRMAIPIIFNEKGEELVEKSFVLRGSSSCDVCGYKFKRSMMTHPDPYPICLRNLIGGLLYSEDNVKYNNNFPECIYVQIKLTPAGRTKDN
ncbi:hypothetical protein [Endozoicomonas sp. 4G]|uniref:hypothetical protein n=1 Tax=Endozoicomonas sp. 4G TaxID=2872754 RepID=UPI0020790074|nr:hypothetical protein [Endozoicomonas sp. 4G]